MIVLPRSNDTDLRQILYDVQEGKIQLPEFQRDWTWDDNRIRGIIASLSQGYPMGAVMQLQYGNPDIKFKYRTITGVENKNATPEYLVLDGQQRLTSIYQSTYSNQVVATKTDKGKSIKRFYYLDMNKCLDDNEDRLDAVIIVPQDRKIKTNFDRDIIMDLSTREFEYQLKMFPINIIYDNTQLMQWNFGYMMYYKEDVNANDLLNRFQKEVVETILQYKLPVITLDKSTPREAVCKVFETLNRYSEEYKTHQMKKSSKGFLPPVTDTATQVGKLYARTVLNAYYADKITARDTSGYLLNLKAKNFGKLERWCF